MKHERKRKRETPQKTNQSYELHKKSDPELQTFKNNDNTKAMKPRAAKRKNFILAPGIKWFEISNTTGKTLTFSGRGAIEELYNKEVEAYKTTKEYKKVSWALKQGTLRDKQAAYMVLFADSVAHNLGFVENLISLADPKCKREAIMAMETLHKIVISAGLPNKRKLISLRERDLNKPLTESCALLWLVEDKIKVLYHQLLKNLDSLSFDQLETTKMKAIYMMAEFLAHIPEQEQFLLTQLCNKLGDPTSKVCARVSHLLNQLISMHPNMRMTVVKEVERVVYRPKANIYYALVFLTQVLLDEQSTALAQKLISIYLLLFTTLAKTKTINDKVMKALLTGASRAYPYCKKGVTKEQLDSLFFISHQVKFSTSIQALILLYQVLDVDHTVSDRFYSTLYGKLLDPEMPLSKYQHKFINLMYRALKYDKNVNRIKAFVKRILQVAMYQGPGLCGAFLYLISRLVQDRPELLIDNEGEDNNQTKEILSDSETADANKPSIETETTLQDSNYDPYKRDPRYSGAENSQFAEQWPLNHFYHPSVTVFQTQLKDGITYSGDPLQDFTLARFLEKFVYKNPKSINEDKVSHSSVFGKKKQPMKGKDILSTTYLNQKEEMVPQDEKFIFVYLRFKEEMYEQLGVQKDDDNESVASDDFDILIEKEEKSTGMDFSGNMFTSDNKDDFSPDDDEEVDYDNDDEFNEAMKEFSDVDDELEEPSSKRHRGAASLDTQEIDDLMDDDDYEDGITSQAVANPDKAHPKQLHWEQGQQKSWKKNNKGAGNKKQKNKHHKRR